MGSPLLCVSWGQAHVKPLKICLKQNNISVQVRLELGSNEAIKQGIAGGMGISVLSRHTLAFEAYNDELTILDVQNFPIQRRWYVAYLSSKRLSVIAQTFLEYLLQGEP